MKALMEGKDLPQPGKVQAMSLWEVRLGITGWKERDGKMGQGTLPWSNGQFSCGSPALFYFFCFGSWVVGCIVGGESGGRKWRGKACLESHASKVAGRVGTKIFTVRKPVWRMACLCNCFVLNKAH